MLYKYFVNDNGHAGCVVADDANSAYELVAHKYKTDQEWGRFYQGVKFDIRVEENDQITWRERQVAEIY